MYVTQRQGNTMTKTEIIQQYLQVHYLRKQLMKDEEIAITEQRITMMYGSYCKQI